MENRKILNIAIGMVAFAALLVLGLVVFNASATAPGVPARPTALLPTATPSTPTPTITTRPTSTTTVTNAPTLSPVTGTSPIATPTPGLFPTITNGPEYPAIFAEEGIFIRPASGKPLVSRETAFQAMTSRSQGPIPTIISDHEIVTDGQTTLYTAYYGLVTVGYRGPNGLWAGSFLNIPVENCTVKGDCTPTGEVLDHLENRPMWLFDFEVDIPIGGVTCPPAGTPCPTPRDDNHAIDLVDAQTLMFIGGMSYYRP
ncbi:MAG: hypothetical protein J0I20_27375 [Chloroflexi bacterium]|nr:hypothetical protein [Chloroflexota bacterium]OJV98323.1 MAG: hypothetical protein BGO39_16215 [Chloroflexi bacterium 54-19]